MFTIKQNQKKGILQEPKNLSVDAIAPLSRFNLVDLQRTVGNYKVNGLIESDRSSHFKIKPNKPSDTNEQEADFIAEKVMQKSSLTARRLLADRFNNQINSTFVLEPERTYVPSVAHNSLGSSGYALDPQTRSFMEPRFGQDFSQVKIHTDNKAVESANDFNARAYTTGNHIVFGKGQYAPNTDAGKRLLAHELAHVVQQSTNPNLGNRVIQRSPLTLDDNTKEEERKKLRVLIPESIEILSPGAIKDAMTTKSAGFPQADIIAFSTNIAEKIKPGLLQIAQEIYGENTFYFNTVTSLPLDLKAYGGIIGVYRFSLVQLNSKTKAKLIIEQLAGISSQSSKQVAIAEIEAFLKQFDFKLDYGFATDDKKRMLYAALRLISNSILNRVKGLTFSISSSSVGDKNEAGHYDPNGHNIEFYQTAFTARMNSFDPSRADFFTLALAHEIGHALDYDSYINAKIKRDKLKLRLKEVRIEARKIKNPGDSILGDDDARQEQKVKEQEEIKKIGSELSKAEEDLEMIYKKMDPSIGGEYSQSKSFKAISGKPISSYGAHSRTENFAELFALFVLDPLLLKSIRPDAYQFFIDRF